MNTTPDDSRAALADNKPSTNHFLRRVHNLAVGMGWLPWRSFHSVARHPA
jgi:hypothetical protein